LIALAPNGSMPKYTYINGVKHKLNPSKHSGARLLSHDPERGVTHWWHWDVQRGKGIVEESWDNKAVLDNMQAIRATSFSTPGSGNLKYLASVPMGTVMEWLNGEKLASGKDGILRVRDQAFVKKKLRDPKYRKFRTTDSGAI